MATVSLPEFTPGLAAARVDEALRAAVVACDQARQCAALWFAEVARRRLFRDLGFASLEQYACEGLGFSQNRYWQFRRLADDLERLPALRDAVTTGQLGWTKAQQITRVATPETETAWVEKARTLGRRVLEREVRSARRKPAAANVAPVLGLLDPGTTVATMPVVDPPVAVTYRLGGMDYARYEALLERLRKLGLADDREQLLLMAFDALLGQVEAERSVVEVAAIGPGAAPKGGVQPADTCPNAELPPQPDLRPQSDLRPPSDLRRRKSHAPVRIVVHRCPDCERAAVVTGQGERRLSATQADAAACDAVVHDGGRNRATIPPAVRESVLARDGHRCQGPGCRSTRYLEVHHVVPRSRGGSNKAENLITLCSRCHAFVHEHPGALAPAQVGARDHAP